jgi:hypothetical protein
VETAVITTGGATFTSTEFRPGPLDQAPELSPVYAALAQRRSSTAAAVRTASVIRVTTVLSSFQHCQNSGTSR